MAKKRRTRKKRTPKKDLDFFRMRPQAIIRLTPDEQLALWNSLQELPNLTTAQQELGAMMRGKA